MKKSSNTSENVNAVVLSVVENKPKKQGRKQKNVKPQETTAEQPKAKTPKFVDVKFDASALSVHTEKAQLVKFMKEEQEIRIWLPSSQIEISQDNDNPNINIIRMAAWLFFRSGLNQVASAVRWSSAKAQVAQA